MALQFRDCDFCGYDMSNLTKVIEVWMHGNWPDAPNKHYQYCSEECNDDHQDDRIRDLEKTND